MSRSRYNQACRTLVVVSAIGQFMALLFGWAAIAAQDWQYLPFVIGAYLPNIILFTIVTADGAKWFGEQHHQIISSQERRDD